MDFEDYPGEIASGPGRMLADICERTITVSASLGPVDHPYGWKPIQTTALPLADGSIATSELTAFCAAVVENGWLDPIYAACADVAVMEVAGLGEKVLTNRFHGLGIMGVIAAAPDNLSRSTLISASELEHWRSESSLVDAQAYLQDERHLPVKVERLEPVPGETAAVIIHHSPLQKFRLLLPLEDSFPFFACCSAGRFEFLAAWHEMISAVAAGLQVPVSPGDTLPVKAFAFSVPPSRMCPTIIPGAFINPSKWLEPTDEPHLVLQ